MGEQWSNASLCINGHTIAVHDAMISSIAAKLDDVDKQAREVLRLHKLATPGPWDPMIGNGAANILSQVLAKACPADDGTVCCISDRDGYGNQTAEYNDAALIAYYRTAAPVLALALLRLRALVAEKNPELLSSGVRHDDG